MQAKYMLHKIKDISLLKLFQYFHFFFQNMNQASDFKRRNAQYVLNVRLYWQVWSEAVPF